MALTNWLGSFRRAQALDLSHDLERGYEAALLIQSIELEHYNDRPVRPEIVAAPARRRPGPAAAPLSAALEVCRQSLVSLQSAPRRTGAARSCANCS